MNLFQSRRQFLERTSTAVAGIGLALGLSARTHAQSVGANDRVVLGLIGCGGMGRTNLRKLMGLKGVAVAAVCDVDEKHMDDAVGDVVKANLPAPKRYKDFRDLLADKDITAVIIGTPDHWHAVPFIAACEAGKDIYCEKPISHNFMEAKAMMNAAKHFGVVVQVGTWQRSVEHFKQAIDYVKSGALGDITVCRGWSVNPFNGRLKSLGHQPAQTPPPELDWNFWLGPAPYRPYIPSHSHFTWRWYQEYGGGLMTDWGVHMLDIVLLGMQQSDPQFVSAVGGRFAMDDDRDTPDTLQAVYQFPKFIMQWENRFNNGRGLDGGIGAGAEFIGTNGTLIVDRTNFQFFPENKDAVAPPTPSSAKDNTPHFQNFLDCIRTRQKPASDIESMAKTTMICHLGNMAWQSGKVIRWDAQKQDVANKGDVKHCLAYQREYRKPWTLKMYKA